MKHYLSADKESRILSYINDLYEGLLESEFESCAESSGGVFVVTKQDCIAIGGLLEMWGKRSDVDFDPRYALHCERDVMLWEDMDELIIDINKSVNRINAMVDKEEFLPLLNMEEVLRVSEEVAR